MKAKQYEISANHRPSSDRIDTSSSLVLFHSKEYYRVIAGAIYGISGRLIDSNSNPLVQRK